MRWVESKYFRATAQAKCSVFESDEAHIELAP